MSLLGFPNEALLIIADNLHCYRGIRALRLANRRLHSLLKQRLVQFSIKKCHKTLLCCAAAAGDSKLAAELLDNLATAQTKSSDSNSQKITDPENDYVHSAFLFHPIFKKGYTSETIVDIQNAFLAAIEANSK